MSNNSRGCCSWLCKCLFGTEEVSSENHSNSENVIRGNNNPNYNYNNEHSSINLRLSNQYNPSNRNLQQNTYVNHCTLGSTDQEFQTRYNHVMNKIKIFTKIEKLKIISLNEYDKELNNKYNCPICLKYLNYVLKSSCCGNHICIFCYDDYITTYIKYDFVINCPFCGKQDKEIRFEDVELEEEVKNYLNSVNHSPINISNNNAKGISWPDPTLEIVELNEI